QWAVNTTNCGVKAFSSFSSSSSNGMKDFRGRARSCRLRRLELVAKLPHRLNEARRRRIGFDLVAQGIDEAVDTPRRDHRIVAPHVRHDRVATERPPRMLGKVREQLELLR